MAEIITLGNGTVIKNYPSFHENWDTHFNKLKESFDWIETYNTLIKYANLFTKKNLYTI
jgi:hypothetical protein